MTVEINSKSVVLPDEEITINHLFELREIDPRGKAVAVDGRVVARNGWAAFKLAEGMKITIITAVCGG